MTPASPLSKSPLRCLCPLLLACLFTVSIRPALAASGPRALVLEGLKLREAGKDREALDKFKAAYALSPRPRILAQVALAHQALGEWIKAETALKEALDSNDRWIRSKRKPLEAALETIQSRLATLEVLGDPEGSEIRINGAVAGKLPLKEAIRVVAGTVVIEASLEGYQALSRTLNVRAGSFARERIQLIRLFPEKEEVLTQTPPPTIALEEEASSSSGSLAPWAYASGGTGLALLGGGVVALLVRNDNLNQYNDDERCLVDGRTRRQNCGSNLDTANTAEALAIAGFVTGGALAATSVVLFILDGNTTSPEEGTTASLFNQSIQCTSGVGDLGLACQIRF